LIPEELALLENLRGSLQTMWRGGWVDPGEFGGVALLRNQRCLGLWSFEEGELVYRPIESGQITVRAATLEEAHWNTLLLLGDLPPLT